MIRLRQYKNDEILDISLNQEKIREILSQRDAFKLELEEQLKEIKKLREELISLKEILDNA